MGKRPPLGLGLLPFGILGLLLGLGDYGRLAGYVLERYDELRRSPPTPVTALWVAHLRGTATALARADRLLIGLSVLALIGAFFVLAATLSPRFRLLKRAEENPGSGLSSHVEVGPMLAAALAVLGSLWLVGVLAPLGMLLSGGKATAATRLLGGLPLWVGGDGVGNALLLSLVLCVVLWFVWGPRGPLYPAEGVSGREVLAAALLAAGAALPAIVGLFLARGWMYESRAALSLSDASGWRVLLTGSWVLPVLCCLYLALVIRACRPRPLPTELVTGLGLLSLAGVAIAVVGTQQGHAALQRMDVGATSLAARLGLQSSPLERYAAILAPDGSVIPAVTEDGVSEGPEDRIGSSGEARAKVAGYLEERHYRTTLAERAFRYLDGCRGLDWESLYSLQLRLEVLEKAPTPLASRLLLERLGDCAVTPEAKAVLDRIADPNLFYWPEPEGSRRLGAAYVRFGDLERGRRYLLKAQLDPEQTQVLLGGMNPLADGVVRGKVTVDGKPLQNIRLGLIGDQEWPRMAGLRPAYSWSAVIEAAHTDARGNFEFRNIPEGRYVLAITGARIGTTRGWEVDRTPGVIEVNRFAPQVTVPKFDVRSPGPTVVPPGTDMKNAV